MTERITKLRLARRPASIRAPSVAGIRVALLSVVCMSSTFLAPLGCTGGAADGTSLDQEIEAALEIQDGFQRAERLIALLASAGEADREALSARVRDRYRPIDTLDHLLLVKAWARQDPEAATKWARAAAPESIHGAAVEAAVKEWARREPLAAAAELPMSEAEVARPLVAGWFESGQPGLSRFVLSQGALESGQLLIAAYLRELIASEGSAAATDWVASVDGDPALMLAVRRHAGKELAAGDPEAAIAFCEQYCDDSLGTAVRIFVARRLAEVGSGRRAVDWLAHANESDLKEREQAMRAAYLAWLADDREEALAWAERAVTEYGEAQWFQPVVGLVVSAISWNEPEAALVWADRLRSPERKKLALITVARRWRDIDPAAAEAWLADSPLSEESRSLARQYPKNYPRKPPALLPYAQGAQ